MLPLSPFHLLGSYKKSMGMSHGRCYTTCSHLAAASYLLTLYYFHSKMKCFCHGFVNDKHSLPAFTSCPDMESSLLIGQTCQTSDWELFTIPLSFFLSLRPSPVQYIEQTIIIRSVMFIPLLQGLTSNWITDLFTTWEVYTAAFRVHTGSAYVSEMYSYIISNSVE